MPTALIVEDEPEANKLLAMLVRLRGFQTVSAFTGGEAINKARECNPDVVFLDLMLPDINGYEVCRVLKSQQPTSAIPVVIVTARVAADNRLESFTNGADDYIPKPYTPDQIFESLNQAADWKRDLGAPQVEGIIPLVRVGADSLRQLARLRSLVFARTSMGFKVVEQIFAEIHRIWAFVDRCEVDHHSRPPITLAYLLDDQHLLIQLRDHAGWMEAYRARFPENSPTSPDELHFGTAEAEDSTDCLSMDVKIGYD